MVQCRWYYSSCKVLAGRQEAFALLDNNAEAPLLFSIENNFHLITD